MPDHIRIPLTSQRIQLDSDEFEQMLRWSYADSFVSRLLRDDLPVRMRLIGCELFAYRNPQGEFIGFGTIEESAEYQALLDGRSHAYLPLLAVNPAIKSLGYGSSILEHLIQTATTFKERAGWPSRSADLIVLDVYARSVKAYDLYLKFGFQKLVAAPRLDPDERNEPYFVMFKPI